MKKWIAETWAKIKKWALSVLIALGLVAAPLVYSEVVNFTYIAPVQNIDGSELVPGPDYVARLYCNGEFVQERPVDGNFNPNLSPGTYTCVATVVNNGQESDFSNEVTRVVEFPIPNAPVLDP